MRVGSVCPRTRSAADMMRLLELSEPLWASGRRRQGRHRVHRPSTDTGSGAVIFPIYSALYHWGAVVIGPRDFELPGPATPDARLIAARYRGRRLARLARNARCGASRSRRSSSGPPPHSGRTSLRSAGRRRARWETPRDSEVAIRELRDDLRVDTGGEERRYEGIGFSSSLRSREVSARARGRR